MFLTQGAHSSGELLDRARPFHLLQNILGFYLDMPCFLIDLASPREWHTLVARSRRVFPSDFENVGQWKLRAQYNDRMVAAAARQGKPQWAPLHGLNGLFVPVMKDKVCLGVLQSGVFLAEVPGDAQLLRLWKGITGRAPGRGDSLFMEYTRALATTPVLDKALLEAFVELLGLFGGYLAGETDGTEAAQRMARLQSEVIAPKLWHRGWLEWHVMQRTFYHFGRDTKVLQPWEKEELGIERFPTTVLAARREGTGEDWKDLLANADFFTAARSAATGLGELLAFPHGSEGVLLLTSPDPQKSGDGRAEIRKKAERFADIVGKELGCRIWLGVGRTDSDGTRLADSYHEAVAALHSAVTRAQTVAFFGEVTAQAPETPGAAALRRQTLALVRTVMEKGGTAAQTQLGVFIQDVLRQARGRPETVRRHFFAAVQGLLSARETVQWAGSGALTALEDRIDHSLESAVGFAELEAHFREAFGAIVETLERPALGDQQERIRSVCDAVAAEPQLAWTLPETARRYGFSTTSFSRAFSLQTGSAFSAFVLERRLEKAQRMLREGVGLNQVAHVCGFSSANYFCQAFKRVVGVPPSRFSKREGRG
jgi:AraC-like DNA-binding protein